MASYLPRLSREEEKEEEEEEEEEGMFLGENGCLRPIGDFISCCQNVIERIKAEEREK